MSLAGSPCKEGLPMKKAIYQRSSRGVCPTDVSAGGYQRKRNPYVFTGGILLAVLILLAILVPVL